MMSKQNSGRDTQKSVSANISTGAVSLNSTVVSPATTNQTLMSLFSTGQISRAAMEGAFVLGSQFGGD